VLQSVVFSTFTRIANEVSYTAGNGWRVYRCDSTRKANDTVNEENETGFRRLTSTLSFTTLRSDARRENSHSALYSDAGDPLNRSNERLGMQG
jgi:hypothetical protein